MEGYVSQEHIDNGIQNDAYRCPVALCLQALGLKKCLVGSKDIVPSTSDLSVRVKSPDPVRRRIQYYDRTGKMKPFKFEIPKELQSFLPNGGVV